MIAAQQVQRVRELVDSDRIAAAERDRARKAATREMMRADSAPQLAAVPGRVVRLKVNAALCLQDDDLDAVEARLVSAAPYVQAPDRDSFRECGCAIKSALGDERGHPVFDQWAREHAGGRYDREENRTIWDGITPNKEGGITVATFFRKALDNGWKDTTPPDAAEAASTSQANPAAEPRRYRVETSAEVLKRPPMDYTVKGVLPAQGVGAVFGPSGSGKSFVVQLLGCVSAAGRPFFSCRTKARPVLYICLEGEHGIRNRVAAIAAVEGAPPPDQFRLVLGQPFNITDRGDVCALANSVNEFAPDGGAMVIVDTLNRAAPGVDENSASDMGRVLDGAKELQRLVGGLVLLVHHTGKDASKGMRGSSALQAGVDAAIEVRRDGVRREWCVSKAKDGEDGKSFPFALRVVDLGRDADGDPITSCVVSTDGGAIRQQPRPAGKNQALVFNRIQGLIGAGRTDLTGAPAGRPALTLDAAVDAGAASLVCEARRRKTIARAVIGELAAGGFLMCNEGVVWLPS